MAIRVWEGCIGELVFSGYRGYVGDGEEICRWVVEMVAQKSEWQCRLKCKKKKKKKTGPFLPTIKKKRKKMVKMVNFMWCVFYHNLTKNDSLLLARTTNHDSHMVTAINTRSKTDFIMMTSRFHIALVLLFAYLTLVSSSEAESLSLNCWGRIIIPFFFPDFFFQNQVQPWNLWGLVQNENVGPYVQKLLRIFKMSVTEH